MCVSDHMDLQNRVGSSGFNFLYNIFLLSPESEIIFKNKKIVHFRTDFRKSKSLKTHNFSQNGPICFLYDLQ